MTCRFTPNWRRGLKCRTRLTGDIEKAFKQVLGVTARLRLLPTGAFDVTEGKTRRVIRSYP